MTEPQVGLVDPKETQKKDDKFVDILKCGDSLDLMRKMPDSCVDLIVTDPPYDISATNKGGTVNNVKKLNQSLGDLVTSKINKGYDIEAFNTEFVRLMKDINIYIWCNKVQIPAYFDFYVNKRKCKFDIICWHKPDALPTYSNKYLTDTEYCLYFRHGGKCFPKSYDDAKTYYVQPINRSDKKKYGHPTIKPLDLTEKFIRNSSREGEIVFDPFLGSGTTAVACIKTNRHYIGYELNEDYLDLAKRRIQETINAGSM